MLRWLFMLSLLLVLGGCARAEPPAASSSAAPLHVLVDLEGQAELKRSGWSDYAPAFFGTVVRAGDQIRVTGAATLICADLQLTPLRDYQGGIPCAAEAALLTYAAVPIPAPRAQDGQIPLMITPVGGQLLSARPLLRWTPTEDAEGYRVTLLRGATVLWEREPGAETSMAYPEDADPLAPGATYQFVVAVANDPQRSSQQAQSVGGGVRLLSEADAAGITERAQQIAALATDRAGQILVTASLYQQQRLYAEALELLEELPAEPSVLRQRGEIYRAIGLAGLAEAAYQQALAESATRNDQEGQAIALHILGQLAVARGDANAAREHLSAAQAIYGQLGDLNATSELEASLESLPGE